MFELMDPYKTWGWSSFFNNDSVGYGDLECPNCGTPYAPSGFVTLNEPVQMKDKLAFIRNRNQVLMDQVFKDDDDSADSTASQSAHPDSGGDGTSIKIKKSVPAADSENDGENDPGGGVGDSSGDDQSGDDTSDREKLFTCDVCDFETKWELSYKRHLESDRHKKKAAEAEGIGQDQ